MSAASHMPISFGRYVLFDFIGKGGMAEIYLARQRMQLGSARLCVVKRILPELAGDAKFSEMLVHEAKLAARLSHGNVVQVFDLGRQDDRLFIAMEYVEGLDLNGLLTRCSRARIQLPFELSVEVVRETLRGLDYAHRRADDDGRPLELVHRDVSPSNVLLSFDGGVKLCDFGIARANDALPAGSASSEVDHVLLGKAGYMSPEQARGEPIDARADVFATGIVLWELVSGRRMYRADDDRGSLLDQARAAVVPELPRRGLPEEEQVHAIVARALARARDSRYPSAASMLRDLDDYVARANLRTNTLVLGDWLTRNFGEEIVVRRRARERALSALERGAPIALVPLAPETRAQKVAPESPLAAPAPAAPPVASPVQPRRGRAAVAIALVAAAIAALTAGLLASGLLAAKSAW